VGEKNRTEHTVTIDLWVMTDLWVSESKSTFKQELKTQPSTAPLQMRHESQAARQREYYTSRALPCAILSQKRFVRHVFGPCRFLEAHLAGGPY
jgi:hypothetical protein